MAVLNTNPNSLGGFIGSQLRRLSEASPIKGKLWSGTPLTNFLAGPVQASEQQNIGDNPFPKIDVSTTQPAPSSPPGGGTSGSGGITSDEALKRGLDINQLRSQGLLMEDPVNNTPDFNALIAPALEEFDRSMSEFQTGFGQQEAGILQSQRTKGEAIRSGVAEAETTTARRRGETEAEGEKNINEERSRLNEILQGIQARFGGRGGLGAFSGELSTRQTLKNIGNMRMEVSQNIQKLEDVLGSVKETARIAVLEAQDFTTEKINQARENLNSNLAQIRGQKGQLQARKAELAFQAMQFYQQQIQQVRANNTQFLQNLYLKEVESENAIKEKIAGAKEAVQKLQLKNMGTETQPNWINYNPIGGVITPAEIGGSLEKGKKKIIGFNTDGTPIYSD